MTDYPEHAERIIMQWASEHPVMTNPMRKDGDGDG